MSKEQSEHLTAAIEQLSDDINGLMQVAEEGTLLKELVDEVKVLRSAIDDLRAEVEWAARNLFQHGEPRPLPQPITSMPLDPCDPAFAGKLNAVSRHDLPADDEEPMFDDDAEYFREGNSYPLDDEEEGIEEQEDGEGIDVGEAGDDFGEEEVENEGANRLDASPPATAATATAAASLQTEAMSSQSKSSPMESPVTPSAASPTTAELPSPRTAAPVTISADQTVTAKKQPLATRLFLHRHLADLVRLLGHSEHLAEDFQHMVQVLFATYGEETVKEGIDELVRFEHRDRQAYVRLKPEVAKLAVQIIGRPASGREPTR